MASVTSAWLRRSIGGGIMINKLINELVKYGMDSHLVEEDDKVYVTNRLLELFGLMEFTGEAVDTTRPLNEILEDMMAYAFENGIMKVLLKIVMTTVYYRAFIIFLFTKKIVRKRGFFWESI